MTTPLIVIGGIAMLVAFLLLVSPVFFGLTDGYFINLYLAKYAFYTSSLVFIGFLFEDERGREYMLEGSGVFMVIVSFIACCFTLVHIGFKIYLNYKKRRDKIRELARQNEIKAIHLEIDKLQKEKSSFESDLGSRYLLTHFTQLLGFCGGRTEEIENHSEMLKIKVLIEEISKCEQAISSLRKKL